MILRKGIKKLPSSVTKVPDSKVERPKAVQQPPTKVGKAVTKINSLSDLAKVPEFAAEKRYTAVIKNIDFQGNLVLGNVYTVRSMDGKNRTFKRMTIPHTVIPAGTLGNARVGMTVSYNVIDRVACNFKLESDVSTGLGLSDFSRECGMCINVSQAEMLAVTSGLHKTREFFEMSAVEKTEYVRDMLFSMFGENTTTCVIKNTVYYSIPVRDLSEAARVIFADKIATNTAAFAPATTANNVATTATTLTTATGTNVAATEGTAVAA